MGLWDDKCKKCLNNSWECKCNEKLEEFGFVDPAKSLIRPKTMEELKENMNDTITPKKKK